MKVKRVHSTTVTVPGASQRPIPLKRKTLPTNNTSPVKSQKPIAQAPPCDNPQLPPRAQSLPQSVVKHTVVDLPAGKTSGDEHPMKLAVKQFVNPKRKPIPLPVAQSKPKENVDFNEQLKTLQVGLDELSSRVKKLETHCRQLQLQNQFLIETDDYKGGPDKHMCTQDLSSFNPTMVSSSMIRSSLRV